MKHKYLRELNLTSGEIFPFGESDYPEMDPRDTFSLDMTLALWLYERLRYLQEEASKIVDYSFHKFEIDGEQLTEMQCMERMIEDCRTLIVSDDIKEQDKRVAVKDDLFKVLSKVYFALWW